MGYILLIVKPTNMKYVLLIMISLLTIILIHSCKQDEVDIIDTSITELSLDLEDALIEASNGNGLSYFKLPNSDDYDKIPQDPNNPLTAEKIKLGKLLYHETGLAINPMNELSEGTYSCASCHFASAGFQAGRFQGIGEGGVGFGINGEGREKGTLYLADQVDVQAIRTPTAMNGAYQKIMLWNGQFGATGMNVGTEANWTAGTPKETNNLGFEGLETQAIAGLGVHRMDIDSNFLNNYPVYKTYLDDAFPNVPTSERYALKSIGLAIAAYERTLLSNQSPFQKWLRDDELALNEMELKGALLFFGKANCSSCHTGPALNKMEFHAIGMNDLFECPEEVFKSDESSIENMGRGGFTQDPDDNYKFKTPQLYNMSDSPFLGHGASFRSIRDVVVYKNNGIAENSSVPNAQLSNHFQPLNLTEQEINELSEFLETGLRDPNLKRYEPDVLPSGNCFPFNDPLAANELGCN